MSLGINLLEYVTKILSKKISNSYQVGVIDNHHKAKIDYPSGTALMLANAISIGKNKNFDDIKGKIFLNRKGKLQNKKINFFIKRKGKTIGEHSIVYKNKVENIELKHVAFSRELFADGAIKAAAWIFKKNKGLFNMQSMFDLK
jgi:4-hydroxy-tetrahydrodipicolinate reductase